MDKLMKEHKELNPCYSGSPVAPLPVYPEKGKKLKSWEHWEREQKKAARRWLGTDYFDELEKK